MNAPAAPAVASPSCVLFGAAARSTSTTSRSSGPTRCTTTQQQPAADRRGVRPRARVDRGRRQRRSPAASPTDDRLKYLRQYTERQALRPGHRLLLAGLRRDRDRAGRERGPRRHRRPRCSSAGSSTCSPGRDPAGGNVALTLDPAAQKAAYDGLLGRHDRGAVVALDPTHRRDPRAWSAPRRTTRTTLSSHDTGGGPDELRATAARRSPGRCSTGRSGRPTRPARPSSWSPRPRRWRAASTRRTAAIADSAQLNLPQTHGRAAERERRRRARSGAADR